MTDSLFKETGLLSSPAFSRAEMAQAICFILIRGLKMLFFSRLPKYDKQPLCSSPLFTACSMLCCKIFTVKLSTMLATRPDFAVWWHLPSVYAPSAPPPMPARVEARAPAHFSRPSRAVQTPHELPGLASGTCKVFLLFNALQRHRQKFGKTWHDF